MRIPSEKSEESLKTTQLVANFRLSSPSSPPPPFYPSSFPTSLPAFSDFLHRRQMGHLFLLLVALLLTSTRATAVHPRASAIEEASFAGIRGVIGSRPPSCEGRCRSCGHCEAVQVPISPQQLHKSKEEGLGHGSRAAATAGGRAMPASYDDHSNYKPLSWRCKCGRHILDP